VPYVVRYDAMIEAARIDEQLVLNVDVAPTLAALAGSTADDPDGRSLLPLIESSTSPWRDAFLIEHMAMGLFGAPTFCAVHTDRYVLVRYATGQEEIYDLDRDLTNWSTRPIDRLPGIVAARSAPNFECSAIRCRRDSPSDVGWRPGRAVQRTSEPTADSASRKKMASRTAAPPWSLLKYAHTSRAAISATRSAHARSLSRR
jgi:N-acetylglucosamine-6-sulfatase